jgi:ATP-dependent Clp protease, protease subunit
MFSIWKRLLWRWVGPPWAARHWPKLVKKLGGERHLRDYLLTKRIIALVGPMHEENFTEAIARLLMLLDREPTAEVKLWLHTPGGDMIGGLSLYDQLADSSAPISTYCLGQAGGIAALLLAAGAPGRRFVDPYSVITLLDVSLSDRRPPSTATEMWDLHGMRGVLNALLAQRSGLPESVIRRATTRKGTRLSSVDAIHFGLADAFESDAVLSALDDRP